MDHLISHSIDPERPPIIRHLRVGTYDLEGKGAERVVSWSFRTKGRCVICITEGSPRKSEQAQRQPQIFDHMASIYRMAVFFVMVILLTWRVTSVQRNEQGTGLLVCSGL